MSIIKSIKQVLGLQATAAENHFWDGSVANQLTLKRGTPDAPGTELIKALNGVLSFPNQEQSLAANGYVKLPGGLIVQWGLHENTGQEQQAAGYPIPFPTAVICAQASPQTPGLGNINGVFCSTEFGSLTGLLLYPRYANNGGAVGVATQYISWIAIGY